VSGDLYGATTSDGLPFEVGAVPDGATIDVAVDYADIPRDLRRSIALDLERELGRTPKASEVVTRYEDYLLEREPTPIDPARKEYEATRLDYIARPLVAPW
jgi:hypothetical protein